MKETKILNKKDFNDLWLDGLSEQKKVRRLGKAFSIVKKVGDKQINLLNKHEKSPIEKNTGFIYFLNTVKDTWEKADFAIKLGKGRKRKYAFYPVRSVKENLFRLEYYINQKRDGQDDIARREIMRVAKRLHALEINQVEEVENKE